MSLYTTCALYFLPFLSLSSRATFLLIFKTPLPLESTLVVKYSPLNLTDTFLPAKSLLILIGTLQDFYMQPVQIDRHVYQDSIWASC